jgi:hypothetical protein
MDACQHASLRSPFRKLLAIELGTTTCRECDGRFRLPGPWTFAANALFVLSIPFGAALSVQQRSGLPLLLVLVAYAIGRGALILFARWRAAEPARGPASGWLFLAFAGFVALLLVFTNQG